MKTIREKLRKKGITDAECMKALHLNAAQWLNRLNGRTKFTPLEREVLAGLLGVSEKELFERG